MKNTEATQMTGQQMFDAMKSMTVEQRVAFLSEQRPDLFKVTAPVASFGKAPKDGWNDADRVPAK